MANDKSKQSFEQSILMRMDALLRLQIEANKVLEGFNEAEAARLLKSVGMTPTEIAKVLGKKSATDVSSYLYPKKK